MAKWRYGAKKNGFNSFATLRLCEKKSKTICVARKGAKAQRINGERDSAI
jgi:hypothetical protein